MGRRRRSEREPALCLAAYCLTLGRRGGAARVARALYLNPRDRADLRRAERLIKDGRELDKRIDRGDWPTPMLSQQEVERRLARLVALDTDTLSKREFTGVLLEWAALLQHQVFWERLLEAKDNPAAILKPSKPKADSRTRSMRAAFVRLHRYERAGRLDSPRLEDVYGEMRKYAVAVIRGATGYLETRWQERASARRKVARARRRSSRLSEFEKLGIIHKASKRDPNLGRTLLEMYEKGHLNAAYRKAQEVLRGYEDIEV